MSKKLYFWEKRKAVLINKHDKERVIVPIIEENTGLQITVERSYDTDLFGTFTKEIRRKASQLDTAYLKARKGMELTGLDIGIASEGIFGSHPVVPFIPWNYEIVLLIDTKNDIEIVGESGTTSTNYDYITTDDYKELEVFAEKILFPTHFIVLRPDDEESNSITKGINSWESLREAFELGIKKSKQGKVFVEADTRAFANPTRMENIGKATYDLIKKMKSYCPKCRTPGFSVVNSKMGLPCECCGNPTKEILLRVSTCRKCAYTEENMVEEKRASAGRCLFCNP
ncbi:MAG: hypothetical protein COA82_08170 [Alkaliphilus sp.]|nr:hypothetical protein [bacterium AH-315-L21]MBN4074665.1 hypothetical protein [bacterium AH-315-E09]PHS33856.1 MAG: hypothetical protein COA82_08170 [Alkaliphilus sp.]